MTDPKFSRLKVWLQNTDLQKKNFPLYQLLSGMIDLLTKEQGITNEEITDASGTITSLVNADLLTHSNESALLSQSRNLLAGARINFNDSVANQRTIYSMEVFPMKAGINSLAGGEVVDSDIDHVTMSDGGTPAQPIDDGAGNFIYIPYSV